MPCCAARRGAGAAEPAPCMPQPRKRRPRPRQRRARSPRQTRRACRPARASPRCTGRTAGRGKRRARASGWRARRGRRGQHGLPRNVPGRAQQVAAGAASAFTWLPLVLGPALAMDRMPGPVCLNLKFSSGNLGGRWQAGRRGLVCVWGGKGGGALRGAAMRHSPLLTKAACADTAVAPPLISARSLVAVDALAAGAVSGSEVAALAHEVLRREQAGRAGQAARVSAPPAPSQGRATGPAAPPGCPRSPRQHAPPKAAAAGAWLPSPAARRTRLDHAVEGAALHCSQRASTGGGGGAGVSR